MREKRGELFSKGRLGLSEEEKLTPQVQQTLEEIVREQFDCLATMECSNTLESIHNIIDLPLEQDEALEIERDIEGMHNFYSFCLLIQYSYIKSKLILFGKYALQEASPSISMNCTYVVEGIE